MADVEMRHPTLPAEQTITVAEQSVPVYENAGWARVPVRAAAKKAAPKKKAPAKKPAEPVKPTKEK